MDREIWLVNVPVATVWTSVNSARDIDSKALSLQADVSGWIDSLNYDSLLDLCDGNRVQTQVLYGEEVIVIEEINGWSHVLIPNQPSSKNKQGYPGWIPSCQLIRRQSWNINDEQVAMVTSNNAILTKAEDQSEITLSFATILPVERIKKNAVVVVSTPTGMAYISVEDVEIYSSFSKIKKGIGSDFITSGERFLGMPYLWGGMSSFGYDCSGFTFNMCRANGYTIPRDAHDQAADGKEVDLQHIQPGDLLFFAYEEGKGYIHHVGFYYGDGKMLHCPQTGKDIEITELKGFEYEKELCIARRYSSEVSS